MDARSNRSQQAAGSRGTPLGTFLWLLAWLISVGWLGTVAFARGADVYLVHCADGNRTDLVEENVVRFWPPEVACIRALDSRMFRVIDLTAPYIGWMALLVVVTAPVFLAVRRVATGRALIGHGRRTVATNVDQHEADQMQLVELAHRRATRVNVLVAAVAWFVIVSFLLFALMISTVHPS